MNCQQVAASNTHEQRLLSYACVCVSLFSHNEIRATRTERLPAAVERAAVQRLGVRHAPLRPEQRGEGAHARQRRRVAVAEGRLEAVQSAPDEGLSLAEAARLLQEAAEVRRGREPVQVLLACGAGWGGGWKPSGPIKRGVN